MAALLVRAGADVRGAATGAGFAGGWWFAVVDPYELKEIVNGFLGGDWFAPICFFAGGVLGFIGASLRKYMKD